MLREKNVLERPDRNWFLVIIHFSNYPNYVNSENFVVHQGKSSAVWALSLFSYSNAMKLLFSFLILTDVLKL